MTSGTGGGLHKRKSRMRKTIIVGATQIESRDPHNETVNSVHRPLYEDPKDFFSASLKLRASS